MVRGSIPQIGIIILNFYAVRNSLKIYSTKIDSIIRKNGETQHHNGNFYRLSQELINYTGKK